MMMHDGQVELSLGDVASLVAREFPDWRALPIAAVPSGGTVNALYRVGPDAMVRFPLVPGDGLETRTELLAEQSWVRHVADHVPVDVPEPLGLGRPGPEYAGYWTAYRWLVGEPANVERSAEHPTLATELADFINALHGLDTGGRRWAGSGRGGPLSTRDNSVRDALARSDDLVDVGAVAAVWNRCLGADGGARDEAWIHSDLMPGNLLLQGGRLTAVIDWGAGAVGDRAVDLMPAWNLFDRVSRAAFRTALDVDDATWERGRGWAIVQAIVALPYYVGSNQSMVDNAHRTLTAVLQD